MEKTVSPEERLRRAEEIYYRRKAQGVRLTTSVNVANQNKVSLGKKMFIQIIVCVCIYLGFFIIKGYNNVFSENVINNTKNILSYDINFQNLYNQCVEYFNNNFNNIINVNAGLDDSENKDENSKEDATENSIENVENTENTENASNENETIGDNVQEQNNTDQSNSELNNQDVNGNPKEEMLTTSEENQSEENHQEDNNMQNDGTVKAKADAENITQMQEDAEYIKLNCNIIKPIEGNITSKFGSREETEIISAFHQGIDIGAISRNTYTGGNGRNCYCIIICWRLW